jgi:hypothetical protein
MGYPKTVLIQTLAVSLLLTGQKALATDLSGTDAASQAGLGHLAAIVPKEPLKGEIEQSVWQRYYEAGLRALAEKRYQPAEKKLSVALKELNRHGIADDRLSRTEEALAEVAYAEEKFGEAEHRFLASLTHLDQKAVNAAAERVRASCCLAKTLLAENKLAKAQQAGKDALATATGAKTISEHDRGEIFKALSDIERRQGLDEEALENSRKAVALLSKEPGYHQLDLSDALFQLACQQNLAGQESEARTNFDRAFDIKDGAVTFDQPQQQTGEVVYTWQEGCPRCRQVQDAEYPLKYMSINGVRVAATLVRSENVIAVLISLANCTRNRLQIGVGNVTLTQLTPHRKEFVYVNPSLLDTAMEAEYVSNMTWRRSWLNHIEKTRRIPGYLKNGVLDIDNFYGNNLFGPYAHWDTSMRQITPIVTREQFLASAYIEPENKLSNFLTGPSLALIPTYLEPGESKTGLVYFQREHYESARLSITIGNARLQLPFTAAPPPQ